MAIEYTKFFAPTVLTTSAATLFAVPDSPANRLLRGGRVRFTNTTGSTVTVTAYAVPGGSSAAAGNAFVSAKSIAPNDYLDVDVPIMGASGFVQALASAGGAVTAHALSGGYFS